MDENTNVENTAEDVAVATAHEVDTANAMDVTPTAPAVEEEEKGEKPADEEVTANEVAEADAAAESVNA